MGGTLNPGPQCAKEYGRYQSECENRHSLDSRTLTELDRDSWRMKEAVGSLRG